jgi:hypothetical protein
VIFTIILFCLAALIAIYDWAATAGTRHYTVGSGWLATGMTAIAIANIFFHIAANQ